MARTQSRLALRYGYHGALAIVERNTLVARRVWFIMLSGLFEPVWYLLAIGLGLGTLVGPVTLDNGQSVGYALFVAPALLAVSAMNGAIYDSTINVFWKLRYEKLYAGILNTRLGTGELVIGEIAWAQLRGTAYSAGFLAVMALSGTVRSSSALLALPATVLIGFAFSAVGVAVTSFLRSWQDLELVTLVQLVMFLFSATFFPMRVYPEPVRWLVELSPLYQANQLLRLLCLGQLSTSLIWPICYLVLVALVATLAATRRISGALTH